jgi:hypothetical protein
MFILVLHVITEPAAFWNAVDSFEIASDIRLHHSFPTPDGTRAACVWEAQSIDRLRAILEPVVGRYSSNEYFVIENREGVGRPSRVPPIATAPSSARRFLA